MMTLTLEKPVGEIAAETPATVRVFQKYKIDFCCGGKFSVLDACRGRGVSPDTVLSELNAAIAEPEPGTTDWTTASLSSLIDHIVDRHHTYVRAELPRIDAMLTKVIAVHGHNHPELTTVGEAFKALEADLNGHLPKEEMVLFPAIRKLEAEGQAAGSLDAPITVMEDEHEEAGRALETMREVTGNYAVPDDGCNTYRALFYGLEEFEADLHRHIHLENNILFPRAQKLASQSA